MKEQAIGTAWDPLRAAVWGPPVAVPHLFGVSLQFLSLLRPPDEWTGPACHGDPILADLQDWFLYSTSLVGAFRFCSIRQRLMRTGVPALSEFTLWIGGEGGHS